MKWLIASDLHGSAACCEKILDAYEREGAGKILMLGDLLYHGARNDLPLRYDTRETARLLNTAREHILCVRGNCDSEVDQMVLDFPIMAEYAIVYESGHMIFATHGHRYNSDNLPPIGCGDILLHGHTHVPACRENETHIYLNPGSLTIPKGGSPRSYMTLEDGVFTWKELDGTVFNTYTLK